MSFEKTVGAALAGGIFAAGLGACFNNEKDALDDANKWEPSLPVVEQVVDEAEELDEFQIGEHNFVLGSLENTESPLKTDVLIKMGYMILSSVAEEGLEYTAYETDQNGARIDGSEINAVARESQIQDHIMFLANNREQYEPLLESVNSNVSNSFTLRPLNADGWPTLSFIATEKFEDPRFNTYHDTVVSALDGAQVTELCQALIEVTVDAPGDAADLEHLIPGNELFCNSISRAVIFAAYGMSYEDYQYDIQISPLEIGQVALGTDIPYLRVTFESYQAIKNGEIVPLEFVPTENN